jgi:hypothetical protein
MEHENIDSAPVDTHAERLEFVESQLADVKSTTEALNETLKRLMLKLDGTESPMLSMRDSPLLGPAPNVYMTPLATGAPATNPPPPTEHRNRIKPSPPTEFNGDRAKAKAFWNSVELYMRLAPQQFESESAKIAWVFSFMKSGRAALFVDRVLRHEARTGSPRITSFAGLKLIFIDEFFPKNESHRALMTLETTNYYQGKRTMDEYVDSFKDLIDLAGYTEGVAIVMKFRRGLRRDIQDQIAQLANGRPADNNIHAWYNAALNCAENIESNTIFHGISRAPTTLTHLRAPIPMAPTPIPPPRPTFAPSRPTQNPVPMEIDAVKKKTALPGVCYRCGEPGHRRPDCPRRFDIRLMSMEECEDWMQEKALERDTEEIARRDNEMENGGKESALDTGADEQGF